MQERTTLLVVDDELAPELGVMGLRMPVLDGRVARAYSTQSGVRTDPGGGLYGAGRGR